MKVTIQSYAMWLGFKVKLLAEEAFSMFRNLQTINLSSMRHQKLKG